MSSNREKAFEQAQSNPSTRYLEWKSKEKGFEFYDKEKKEKVAVALPVKFIVLEELHAVSGWNDASSSGIMSNEVKFISKQPMTAKSFKGGEIAKGLYTDIKDKVKNAGGHYVKSIYIMMENGEMGNIKLKGSAVKVWGEFTQKNRNKLPYSWVTVKTFEQGKKGSVSYTTPVFEFGDALSKEDTESANGVYDVLESFLKTYLSKGDSVVEVEEEEDEFIDI
jgi:hypothetical protein